MHPIAWLDGSQDVPSIAVVGGKGAGLAVFAAAGLPVPRGFAVTTDAFRAAMQGAAATASDDMCHDAPGPTVLERAAAHVAGLDARHHRDLAQRAARARALLAQAPVPSVLESAVRCAYAELGPQVPVAVRSSTVAEDGTEVSFAGAHDTYLWVRGAADVMAHVRRCWASLFTDRAVAYRAEQGLAHTTSDMAVVVQRMVQPRAAGVACTLNPENGDRSAVAVESSWGFGEAVAEGVVTPDSYLVDKVIGQITRRSVADKAVEYRLCGDAVALVDVAEIRRAQPSLSDQEIAEVVRLAMACEAHDGSPQDVEWALEETAGPGATRVVLLQSRPETFWSRRPRHGYTGAGGSDYLSGIVHTLLQPLHAATRPAGAG